MSRCFAAALLFDAPDGVFEERIASLNGLHELVDPSTFGSDGFDDRRLPSVRTMRQRKHRENGAFHFSTPGRSHLLMTKISPISMMPAFSAWTSSPIPGTSTTIEISASLTISISSWPTPTVSTMMGSFRPHPIRHDIGCRCRQTSKMSARSHAANVHAGITLGACIRMRSPRMAPPVNGLLGSTAMTASVFAFSADKPIASRSTKRALSRSGASCHANDAGFSRERKQLLKQRQAFRRDGSHTSVMIARAERAYRPCKKSCRSCQSSEARLAYESQYFSRDHKPLNFARAFADRAEFNVSIEFFGRIILDEAVAAMDLNALVRDAHRNFAGVKLCHRRLRRRLHALVFHPCGAMRQRRAASISVAISASLNWIA